MSPASEITLSTLDLTKVYKTGEIEVHALLDGRFVRPGRPDEVVLNETFAEAHGLLPGDQIFAFSKGSR